MQCRSSACLLSSFLVVTAAVWGISSFAQPASMPPSYRLVDGTSASQIPIEVVSDGLVLLRAKVNDHPGWFILDNATEGFIADREYAQRNSLGSGESVATRGGGAGEIAAGVVHDVQISLPGLDLTHRQLIVIPLKTLEPTLGHEVDGIIGSRLFDDFIIAVDYERRRVAVSLPGSYRPSGTETAIPVTLDEHGFQFVDASFTLPGAAPATAKFLIDGGADTYADIYKPFADAHRLPPPAMKLLDEPGTSTGGTTEARIGRAARLTVGPFSIANPLFTFAQDTEGLMAASGYAGLIGAAFLERFTVVFDSRGKQILLAPNRHYHDAAEDDGSGLRIRAGGPGFHRFTVKRIVSPSPAVQAGFAIGDVIESIDDRPAGELTLTELRKMLCRTDTSCSVGVIRGMRHLRFTMKLQPLQ